MSTFSPNTLEKDKKEQLENAIHEDKDLSPQHLFYYARELYSSGDYDKAIVYFNKFLETEQGCVEDIIQSCYYLSICHDINGNESNMLKTLLRTFEYDIPRPEICCQLGQYFTDQEEYCKAAFWYELATSLQKPQDNWKFVIQDCRGYLPNIQLCVCYYKMGETEKSIEYNNRAAEYRPNDEFVLYNKEFFEGLKKDIVVEKAEHRNWYDRFKMLKNK